MIVTLVVLGGLLFGAMLADCNLKDPVWIVFGMLDFPAYLLQCLLR